MEESKEAICTQFRWGVPHRRLAANFNIDRNTLYRYLVRWGCYDTQDLLYTQFASEYPIDNQ